MTAPDRAKINLAELERRANQCVRMHIGLMLVPDEVLRLVAVLREFKDDMVPEDVREWREALAAHGITDEATP